MEYKHLKYELTMKQLGDNLLSVELDHKNGRPGYAVEEIDDMLAVEIEKACEEDHDEQQSPQ